MSFIYVLNLCRWESHYNGSKSPFWYI